MHGAAVQRFLHDSGWMLEYTCTDLPIQQLTLSLRGVVIHAAWQWSQLTLSLRVAL